MSNGEEMQNSKFPQIEKVLPHAIGAVIAILIIIGSNTYGSAAAGAAIGFKAGAGGYFVGWIITLGGLKLYKKLKKVN